MGKFEQFEAFVAVVDHQGFSAAGEKLGIAKSALSRRVSELEVRLKVKLLNRTTRKLSLTSAGEEFYQQVRGMISDLNEAEQKLSDDQSVISGPLKIAAPLSFGYRHLSTAISEFVVEYPEIDLSLDLNDRHIDLVAEGFDMTIRIGELTDSTMIARKLGVIRFVTVASQDYLDRKGVPKHPSELTFHDGLLYSNISAKKQWQYFDNKKSLAVVPATRMSANNGDFLAKMAVHGLGITNGPTFLLDEYVREGKLQVILQEYQRAEVGMYALFPPGRLIPSRVKVLVDFLQQQYGDCPDWDKGLITQGNHRCS